MQLMFQPLPTFSTVFFAATFEPFVTLDRKRKVILLEPRPFGPT